MAANLDPEPVPFDLDRGGGLVLSGDTWGDGAPIVLAHGLTATRRNVLQGSRHLLGRGCRLIAYDARGHGRSTPAPSADAYDYADLAGDLEALLDDRGLERAAIAGSSMGAATAARFALERPRRVTALVLITPAYREPGQLGADALAHWDRLSKALAAGDVEAFVDVSGANELPERWREPARLATRQRIERHRHLDAVARALHVVPRSRAFASLDELERLELPALVVGSRDEADPGHPLATAAEYAERLPRGELVVEEPGDTPLAWQGARLSRAIGDFLERAQS
ncbi:MAG TPA: alpha/beta fold hydrolase [Solirubrobacteraceae bacterium]|nr:alpha/beta fold hydrolase [Solirubrobacteraceae bacterium]